LAYFNWNIDEVLHTLFARHQSSNWSSYTNHRAL
jgi:hypothetical protein